MSKHRQTPLQAAMSDLTKAIERTYAYLLGFPKQQEPIARHSRRIPDDLRPKIYRDCSETGPWVFGSKWVLRLPLSTNGSYSEHTYVYPSFRTACAEYAELMQYMTYELDDEGNCRVVEFDEDKLGTIYE